MATDVGIKCPDDARLPRGARAGVMKTNQLLRSILAGLGVAVAGIPVAYVLFLLPLTLLISAAAGYGAGTLINRAGGRNGGPWRSPSPCWPRPYRSSWCWRPNLLAGAFNPYRLIAMVFAAVAAGVANRRILAATLRLRAPLVNTLRAFGSRFRVLRWSRAIFSVLRRQPSEQAHSS